MNLRWPEGMDSDDLLRRERLVGETPRGEAGAGTAPAD